jgi:Immunoglobulin-like domain of bacterial spore germination
MTRAQRIALAAAVAVLACVGLAAAFVLGRNSGSGSSNGTVPPSTSAPGSSSTPSAPPPKPATAVRAAFGGAPVPGGWRTRFALTFDRRPSGFTVTSTSTGFRVSFTSPVTVPAGVLTAAGADATRYLMHPSWNAAARVLTVRTPFMNDLIAGTVHGVVGDTLFLDDIRPAVSTTNGCLTVSEPAPYTGIFGIFTARGTESAFEGQFTMVVRGGGTQRKQVVHAAGGGPAPFSAQLTPPLEPQPVAGLVVAYELSAKDGQPTCIVKIPVWLSPGG